jgi:hypothetical protein
MGYFEGDMKFKKYIRVHDVVTIEDIELGENDIEYLKMTDVERVYKVKLKNGLEIEGRFE